MAGMTPREQAELLDAAAKALRRNAIQDDYAGLRGHDTVMAIAACMESIAQGRDGMNDLLRAARRIVHGPDGRHDPRAARGNPLAK